MITCGCKIKQLPHVDGVPRDSERFIEYCPFHSGSGEAPIAPSVKENLTVAPEQPKPEKKLKRKKLTIAIADKTFPVALYSGDTFKMTEMRQNVVIQQKVTDDYWKSTELKKDEATIFALVWSQSHQPTEEK